MTYKTQQSAVERADALLAVWQQGLSPISRRTRPAVTVHGNAEHRADGFIGRIGQKFNGQTLVKAAAYGYVALAAKTGMMVEPLVKTWQDGVAEAQRQEQQQAARTEGQAGAHQEETDEKEGQQTMKKTAGAAVDVAGTAAGA